MARGCANIGYCGDPGYIMPGKIFINYRRDDSISMACRLYDRLVPVFGDKNVFMDIDGIPAGVDFVPYVNNKVAECDVLLSIIGPDWIDVKDESDRRRLDNENDFVRIEIAAALARDIRLIPILIEGARMPKERELPDPIKPLVRRQAVELRHAHFRRDADALVILLRDALVGTNPAGGPPVLMLATIVVMLLLGGGVFLYRTEVPEWSRRVLQLPQPTEANRPSESRPDAKRLPQPTEAKRPSESRPDAQRTPLVTVQPLSGVPESTLFANLRQLYLRPETNIAHANLKMVTLAQWALESGWGTSGLATEHYNFARMKGARAEVAHLADIATIVAYQEYDGTDFYLRFESLQNFITGYWRFLERAPYRGWKERAAVERDFISFIASKWAPTDPQYASKVMEIRALLQGALAATSQPAP